MRDVGDEVAPRAAEALQLAHLAQDDDDDVTLGGADAHAEGHAGQADLGLQFAVPVAGVADQLVQFSRAGGGHQALTGPRDGPEDLLRGGVQAHDLAQAVEHEDAVDLSSLERRHLRVEELEPLARLRQPPFCDDGRRLPAFGARAFGAPPPGEQAQGERRRPEGDPVEERHPSNR